MWTEQPGVNGIDAIHDRSRATAHYQQNRQFSISRIIDTDGVPGSEIIVNWAGDNGANGIDIIHDVKPTTIHYPLNTTFAIAQVRDYDGVSGAEICYSWFNETTRFSLIVDRTRSIVDRSGC